MSNDESAARDALWQMTNAYQASQAIHVAATLGIADMLVTGPGARTSWPRLRGRMGLPSTGSCARWPAWGSLPRATDTTAASA